jgi:hypothetical protein
LEIFQCFLKNCQIVRMRLAINTMRAGRSSAITDDVRKAMQESVIPADTKLHRALESGRKARPAKLTSAPTIQTAPERLAQHDSEDLSPPSKHDGQTVFAQRLRVPEASLIEA